MATKKQIAAGVIYAKLVKGELSRRGSSFGEILRQAGYAPSVCKKPSIVTRSYGFFEVVSKELSHLY